MLGSHRDANEEKEPEAARVTATNVLELNSVLPHEPGSVHRAPCMSLDAHDCVRQVRSSVPLDFKGREARGHEAARWR